MKQVTATVISNERLWGEFSRPGRRKLLGTGLIWLKCPDLALEARPGQFVMVSCGEECLLPRPFSIHQLNDKGYLALFYAVLEDGKGTGWLAHRKPQDSINLFGPIGNGFSLHTASRKLLIAAGGNGIAPLGFLAQEAAKRDCSVILLYGTADANRYPRRLLPPQIKRVDITEDGSLGRKGKVTDLLPEFAGSADQIFACGPMAMYRDMVRNKQKLGLEGKPVQVSLEVRMGCGRGMCYSCTVKTKNGLKQVCQDGPVFDLEDIIENELPLI